MTIADECEALDGLVGESRGRRRHRRASREPQGSRAAAKGHCSVCKGGGRKNDAGGCGNDSQRPEVAQSLRHAINGIHNDQ